MMKSPIFRVCGPITNADAEMYKNELNKTNEFLS